MVSRLRPCTCTSTRASSKFLSSKSPRPQGVRAPLFLSGEGADGASALALRESGSCGRACVCVCTPVISSECVFACACVGVRAGARTHVISFARVFTCAGTRAGARALVRVVWYCQVTLREPERARSEESNQTRELKSTRTLVVNPWILAPGLNRLPDL